MMKEKYNKVKCEYKNKAIYYRGYKKNDERRNKSGIQILIDRTFI
jgi:hypothetical protein